MRNLSHAQKNLIAGRQFFKCANKPNSNLKGLCNYECPLWKNNDNNGSFDKSGYEIDHIIEFCISKDNSDENLQALCSMCHRMKTKLFMMSKPSKQNKSNVTLNFNNKNIRKNVIRELENFFHTENNWRIEKFINYYYERTDNKIDVVNKNIFLKHYKSFFNVNDVSWKKLLNYIKNYGLKYAPCVKSKQVHGCIIGLKIKNELLEDPVTPFYSEIIIKTGNDKEFIKSYELYQAFKNFYYNENKHLNIQEFRTALESKGLIPKLLHGTSIYRGIKIDSHKLKKYMSDKKKNADIDFIDD